MVLYLFIFQNINIFLIGCLIEHRIIKLLLNLWYYYSKLIYKSEKSIRRTVQMTIYLEG